jgi:hypothetical protein
MGLVVSNLGAEGVTRDPDKEEFEQEETEGTEVRSQSHRSAVQFQISDLKSEI